MTTETRYRITLDSDQVIKIFERMGRAADEWEKKLAEDAKKAQTKLDKLAKKANKTANALAWKDMKGLALVARGAEHAAAKLNVLNKASGGLGTLAKGALAAAAAIAGIGFAAKEAGGALLSMGAEGAKLKTLDAAFRQLGGRKKDIVELRKATSNMVPDATLTRMRNTAVLSGLSAKNIDKLARVATGAATAMGRDFTESFERILLGTSKLEREFFDELGIKLRSMTVVYQEFAAKAGISVKSLTEAQKQQAFVQEVLKNSTKQLAAGELAKQNAFAKGMADFQNLQDQIKVAMAEMLTSSGVLTDLAGVMEMLKTTFDENRGAIQLLISQGFTSMLDLLPPTLELLKAFMPIMPGLASSMKLLGAAMQGISPIVELMNTQFTIMTQYIIGPLVGGIGLLLEAAVDVSEALGLDMPEGLKKASKTMQEVMATGEKLTQGFDALGAAGEGAAKRLSRAQINALKLETALIPLEAGAKKVGASLERNFGGALSVVGDAMGFTADEVAVNIGEIEADYATLNDMIDQSAEHVQFGTMSMTESIIAGSKDQTTALQALGAHYDKATEAMHRLHAAGMLTGEQLSNYENILLKQTDIAETQILKQEKFQDKSNARRSRKSKKSADDQVRLLEQASLMTMSELERSIVQSDKKYQEILENLDGHEDLKLQIMDQRAAERQSLMAEHATMLADQEAAYSDAMLSQRELAFKKEQDAVKAHFADLREAVGGFGDMDRIAQMESQQLDLLDREKAAEDIEIFNGMVAGLAGVADSAFGAVESKIDSISEKVTKRAARDMQIWAGAVQGMGLTFGATMVNMVQGGENMREQTAQMMGQLFGQLSTAFLTWAVAEGNLLSGNPFAAAAAAIALGTIAAAISSFGSRGKGSASAGGGGGGATSSAARMSSRESGANRGRESGAGVIVYNYGFQQPDDVANRVGQGARRSQSLRGSTQRNGRKAS
jgi:hypothetical protein